MLIICWVSLYENGNGLTLFEVAIPMGCSNRLTWWLWVHSLISGRSRITTKRKSLELQDEVSPTWVYSYSLSGSGNEYRAVVLLW